MDPILQSQQPGPEVHQPMTEVGHQEISAQQPTSSSLKKIIFILLAIIVILGLIGGSYYLGTKKSSSTPNEKMTVVTPTQVVASPTTSPSDSQSLQATLTSLQQALSIRSSFQERKSIDWIDDNSQTVPLKGWSFGAGLETNTYMGKYGIFANINEISQTSLQPLQTATENFFTKNGFVVNPMNNKKNPRNIYYGYTMKDMKCLITLSPQTDPFGDFFCGIIDTEELAWRKELVPVINPKNDPMLQVHVSKLIGNYASGTVGSYGGGAVWYAVKVDGSWKEVWTGQNVISCKPVQQYNIPKEIYGETCSNNY